ncbi:helix-turn-helix domain-containing protein [Paenarthrobacter sp. NPDC089316]|uniref:TrmB family transcriptional regulator n=1 Tax=unclassified Paenarthrobacter TaxID=2634190 RepID=UPI00344647A3
MIEELVQIGLDPKAANLYLAILEMHEPTVAEVAKVTNINRTTAYDLVNSLVQRGMVRLVDSSRIKSRANTKVIQPQNPDRLITDWLQTKILLDKIVPQLQALQERSRPFPRTTYFEGVEGMRHALFETLTWGSDLSGIMSMDDLHMGIGKAATDDYVRERCKRKIWLRVVRSHEKDTVAGWDSNPAEFRHARYAPDTYVYNMTMLIGADRVIMLSTRHENFALKIESVEYAEMQRNLFEILWGASKDIGNAGSPSG